MIALRSIYDITPPPYRTPLSDNPTLLITWWATGCSLFIIIARVFGRYVRTMRLFRDDWWTLASIIPLMIRLGLVHIVLKKGINNINSTFLSDEEIRQREIGSKVVLAARIFFAIYIWMQKLCITEFYKRLTSQFWRGTYDVGVKALRWGLLATFVGVVVSTFAECQPFTNYWQVVPDPGPKCRETSAQLLTMGTLNVFTDVILVIFPIPAIVHSKMTRKRKSQLIGLFSLSFLVVAVTLGRIPATLARHNAQPFRTLMASLEILVATFVSNALVLNSFLRDKGPKRPKFKGHVDTESSGHTRTGNGQSRRGDGAGAAYWGSDEDLVRDVGFGIEMDVTSGQRKRSDASSIRSPRYYPERQLSNYSESAPITSPAATQQHPPTTPSTWGFPPSDGQEMVRRASLGSRSSKRFSGSDAISNHAKDTFEMDGISENIEGSRSGSDTNIVPKPETGSGPLYLHDVGGLLK